MEEQRKKFGMELLPSLHKRLKEEALKRDRPLWALTQEMVEGYLNGGKAEEPEDPDVEMLRRFKEIGSPEDIKFLRGNILVFLRDAEHRRKRKGH